MPKEEPIITNEKQAGIPYPGDLRDYFAAKAMQGIIIRDKELGAGIVAPRTDLATKGAYAYADAMIKAREQ